MSRLVKVNTPGSDRLIEINTDATTWGELREELSDMNISTDGMKGVVRETKVSLQADGAQLPEDDFSLFLFTDKVKSGLDHADMMRDLRDKMEIAFNEVIDAIEEGDYDNGVNDATDARGAKSALSAERRRLEEEMGM